MPLDFATPFASAILLPSGAPHWVLVVGKEGEEYLIEDPLVPKPQVIRLGERARTVLAVRVLGRTAR
jgi:hypothetical protein